MEWQTLSEEPAAAAEQLESDDRAASIYSWRLEQLERAGYSFAHAQLLADDDTVDLHRACALLLRGCPEATALAILL